MNQLSLDSNSVLLNLLIRLVLNTTVLIMITRKANVDSEHRYDFKFSFLAIGMTVFFICFLLESVKLELGFALGLFAIFAILRYRTLQIPIKEMTYLFVIIGLSVINALAADPINYLELCLVNVFFVIGIIVLETIFKKEPSYSLSIRYTKMENLKENKYKELHNELVNETGLEISKVEVVKIDLERGYANLKVFVNENSKGLQFGEKA